MKEKKTFWDYVDVADSDSCWNWNRHLTTCGYGKYYVNGKYETSSRYAWKLIFGEIETGLCVLHNCDNPKCCNPNHLFLGTHADNMRDRQLKGRGNIKTGGAGIPTKLNVEKVLDIRYMLSQNIKTKEIAEKYNIHRNMVLSIKHNTTWKHVPYSVGLTI